MRPFCLTPELALRFARLTLGHVVREFPNKLDHVLTGPLDARTPRELHPIFHGSYDWHSCVHGYWLLARVLRRFPSLPVAGEICALFDAQLVPDKVAGECAYLQSPANRHFERPYGWAWLLKLAAELRGLGAGQWARALAPLADAFIERFHAFLPLATYPVRAGTHANSAFALRLTCDFAVEAGDAALLGLLRETSRRWFIADREAPAWGEPGGDDFLSPTLIEAECLRRVLPADEYGRWFEQFLPRLADLEPATLFRPAFVADRTDGKIGHLDGLNLSRAWCWRSLAKALAPDDPSRAGLESAADRHLAASLPHLADDYMGQHWLATFAVLALDEET